MFGLYFHALPFHSTMLLMCPLLKMVVLIFVEELYMSIVL